MKKAISQIFYIVSHQRIANDVYQLILSGDTTLFTASGQFVNIALPGHFLRRPISVADWNESTLTLIYKVVGEGTKTLSRYVAGDTLDLLVGLGNGFQINSLHQQPILIGGGVGVPPLYNLCKNLINKGYNVEVVLGFTSHCDVFMKDQFMQLVGSEKLHIATMDGTFGAKGTVIDVIQSKSIQADYLYTCGPIPMLQAVYQLPITGQFSFEERMGCGFGGCMGCTHQMQKGYKRICVEGPVFKKEEIKW